MSRKQTPDMLGSILSGEKAAKAPKEELVVFAFRLTPAERDAIHKTAGPRNATRLVRQVAVAFGNEDEAGFKAALKEAKELR